MKDFKVFRLKFHLAIILLSAFLTTHKLLGQNLEEGKAISLSSNSSIDFNKITFLDSLLAEKRVFFFGESHGLPINQSVHFELFKYLNQKKGVRNYVLEGNYSYVYFINKYVQTGNKNYLKLVLQEDNSENEVIKKLDQSFVEFYENLYLLNQTLDAGNKIKIIGIDSDPFYYTNKMIDDIIGDRKLPDELNEFINNLKDLELEKRYVFLPKDAEKSINIKLDFLREEYEKHNQLISSFFGENTNHIKYIIFNPATQKRSDKSLFLNFIEATKSDDSSSYYFQYGRFHTKLKGSSLANRINKSEEYKDQVLSIGSQYNNCDYWFGDTYRTSTFGIISQSSKRVSKAYSNINKNRSENINFVFVDDFIARKTGFKYIIDFEEIKID